jgi:hypothetical protein
MAIILPERVPEPGYYYHHKHDPKGPVNNYAYEVLGISFDTEKDGVWYVTYRPLYATAGVYQASLKLGVPCFDSRLLSMWFDEVEKDGVKMQRYSKINDPETVAAILKAA